MTKFKQVNKQDFYSFIESWPNKLNYDVAGMFEPPLASYNDFSGGKMWPESIVAKIKMDWLGPNGEIDEENHKKFWEYYILNDHD